MDGRGLDVIAMACIMGSAAVAGATTMAVTQRVDHAPPPVAEAPEARVVCATEVAHSAPHVIVAINEHDRVLVTPRMEVHADGACAERVESPDLELHLEQTRQGLERARVRMDVTRQRYEIERRERIREVERRLEERSVDLEGARVELEGLSERIEREIERELETEMRQLEVELARVMDEAREHARAEARQQRRGPRGGR